MNTKKILIVCLLTILCLSVGCRKKRGLVLPEYVAETATLYSEILGSYVEGERVLTEEKHKNYQVIDKRSRLKRAKSLENILDSIGALRQGIDTIICIEYWPPYDTTNLFKYIIKTSVDTLVVEWDFGKPYASTPEIRDFKDYYETLVPSPQPCDYERIYKESNEKYFRAIFNWNIPEFEDLLKTKFRIIEDGCEKRAMRIIVDDGHILDYESVVYGGDLYW